MRLHSGCAVRGGIGNRTFEQWCSYALATMARVDDDAHDAPYRQVGGPASDVSSRTRRK